MINVGRHSLGSWLHNYLVTTVVLGLAISTDGVGSKLLVAQLMDKYDTIGIDCVAMNANDILCVGARPLSLVDYLAVQVPEARLLEQLGKGLYEGAKQANNYRRCNQSFT
jgi:phosphoribosylaminoimidazole (AIR) synthetase